MGKDRTAPRPAFAALLARNEAKRNAYVSSLEQKTKEQASQIRSLRAQLAASVAKARAKHAREAAE